MSTDIVSAARSNHRLGLPPIESGPLGPLDTPFVGSPDDAFSRSLTLDTLDQERRFLEDHINECQELFEQSSRLLAELNERRVLTAGELRAVEAEASMHSRQHILKAARDAREAELAYTHAYEQCRHLERQIEVARRSLKAMESAISLAGDLSREAAINDELDLESDTAELPKVPASDALPRTPTTTSPIDMQTLLTAREYERHVLARNIDERVHLVLSDTVLMVELCEAAIRNDPLHAAQIVDDLKKRLNEALRSVDTLIFELEPTTLNDLGLAATMQRYVHGLVSTTHAPIVIRVSGAEKRYHIAVERAAFRAARAAISNALRHSGAHSIVVTLNQRADMLILTVEDDGAGFEVDSVMAKVRRGYHSGLGQICIDADMLGAEFGIESGRGKGTCVLFIVTISPKTGFLSM